MLKSSSSCVKTDHVLLFIFSSSRRPVSCGCCSTTYQTTNRTLTLALSSWLPSSSASCFVRSPFRWPGVITTSMVSERLSQCLVFILSSSRCSAIQVDAWVKNLFSTDVILVITRLNRAHCLLFFNRRLCL